MDVVDNNAVITNARPVLTINLLTCTKQDLAFSASFKLKFARNDYLHAIVGFFECGFTQVLYDCFILKIDLILPYISYH